MKFIAIFFYLILSSFTLFAQMPEQVLATANAQKFTVADLPADVSAAYVNLSKNVAEVRQALLDAQIIETLFDLEAKSKNTTSDKFIGQIKAKVPTPAEKDIQAIYDAKN